MNPPPPPYFAHPTAVLDEPVDIGPGTKIWHFAHISTGSVLGAGCSVGQNVFVASNVAIGKNVKIQNNVSLYAGVVLEDNVFCGPSCVFTNIPNPRSEIIRKDHYVRTLVRRGATLGANSTIVCGSTIGRYALLAAGAVLPRSTVPDYALMVGVPARQRGWVSRHGHPLGGSNTFGVFTCPESGWRYREEPAGTLRCLDWDEDQPLRPD